MFNIHGKNTTHTFPEDLIPFISPKKIMTQQTKRVSVKSHFNVPSSSIPDVNCSTYRLKENNLILQSIIYKYF